MDIFEQKIEKHLYQDDRSDEFSLSIEKPKSLSIEETKSPVHQETDPYFFDEKYEIVDMEDQGKTMNDKARERIEEMSTTLGYKDAVDFRVSRAKESMDKLYITEERGKSEHDANIKYLKEFKEVLGLSSDKDKIKVITDIRKSGNDLFSK